MQQLEKTEIEDLDRKLPENRIEVNELLRCKLALLLSDNNVYRQAHDELEISNARSEKAIIKGIFNTSLEPVTQKVLALSNSIKPSTIKNICIGSRVFRKKVQEKSKNHIILQLEKLDVEDFYREYTDAEAAEDSLYQFAIKMGFYKNAHNNERLDSNDKSIQYSQKNRKFYLDKMRMLKEIDRKKNLVNKPGCGVSLEKDFAQRLFNKYKGVYAVYYPSCSDFEKDDDKGFVQAAMRISHIFEDSNSSVIRAKLNLPNISCPDARFQYRGYLMPIGDKDFLNITLYLASQTINREYTLPDSPAPTTDVINITCSKMLDSRTCFHGILTSLNQCKKSLKQSPYSAKVLILKQDHAEYGKTVEEQEKLFMQKNGLVTYETLQHLLTTMKDEKQRHYIQSYFSESFNMPIKMIDKS